MRKWIALGIILLLGCHPLTAKAALGSIEIQLQEDEDCEIAYSKVADMVNGLWEFEEEYKESVVDLNTVKDAKELQEAAKEVLAYIDEKQLYMGKQNGAKTIILEDLEEGLYLIALKGNSEMEMLPTLVSVPGWIEEERVYHVTVIPKFIERKKSPVTGWNNWEEGYISVAGISITVIVALFYYKRRYYSK